jgi:hypothetical protein
MRFAFNKAHATLQIFKTLLLNKIAVEPVLTFLINICDNPVYDMYKPSRK